MEEIFKAIKTKNNKLLDKLIKSNNINQRNEKFGFGYMTTAIDAKNTGAAKILFENGFDANTIYKNKPDFYFTIMDNSYEIAKLFIEYGFDIKQLGSSALDFCIMNQNDKIMQLLLDNGAIFNFKNMGKFYSCISIKILEILLNNGFDINMQNDIGDTLLINASMNNNLKMVKYLISKEADLNIQNKSKSTALHFANYSIAKALLEAGADSSIRDVEGKTLLDYAIEENNTKIVKLF